MSLRLIIEDFEGDRMVVPLPEDEGPVSLGRAPDNHVRLPERNVSRRHAELHPREGGGWLLLDTDSYNGLTVNGEAVEGECELKVGDYILLADYQLLMGSQARALEEDVAALTAASQARRQAMLDSQEPAPMADIFAPASVPMGSPAGSDFPLSFESELEPSSSGGRRFLWILGAAGAMSVAAVLAWQMGQPGSSSMKRAQETLAAASVRPVEPKVVKPSEIAGASAKGQAGAVEGSAGVGGPGANPAGASGANSTGGLGALPGAIPGNGAAEDSSSGDAAPGSDQAAAQVDPAQRDPAQNPGGPQAETAPKRDKPSAATSRAQERARNQEAKKRQARARDPARPRDPARSREQAKALIKRARKAAMGGRHQEAMGLARRSFRAHATQESLQVLGLSACKSSHRGLAEFAFNRLRRGDSRRLLVKLCSDAGIALE